MATIFNSQLHMSVFLTHLFSRRNDERIIESSRIHDYGPYHLSMSFPASAEMDCLTWKRHYDVSFSILGIDFIGGV